MQNLDTEAINLISKQVNEGRAEANKIDPDMMYVNFTPKGEIKIYKAEVTEDKNRNTIKIGLMDKDHLIATLPPSSNLKTPQANSKAKSSAQREARERENEISGKKDQTKKVYKANYKGGIITSTDGVNWIDSKGNKVQ